MYITTQKDLLIVKLDMQYPAELALMRSILFARFEKKINRWIVPVKYADIFHDALTAQRVTYQMPAGLFLPVHRKNDLIVRYPGALPLYDFQRKGAEFLMNHDGALLADVPGLGKTIQTIAALEDVPGPHLIFCPASLKYQWESEIKKWEPSATVSVIEGNKEKRYDLWWMAEGPKYVIANYELILKDSYSMGKNEWSTIICDEATRISNAQSKTVKLLKKIPTKKRIALTGTPVSNSPTDLWGIFDWVEPGYLGTYNKFFNKFCVVDPWVDPRWRKTSKYKNLDELAKLIEPYILRRTKEEVFDDFPPKTVETISIQMSMAERELYKIIKNQIFEELQKMEIEGTSLFMVPVKLLRLKQLCDDARLIEGTHTVESSKLLALKDIVEPIVASGEKVIIFTQFAKMADLLSWELGSYLVIQGDVPAEKRHEIVQEFHEKPEAQILIMTEAGAYGLNLQNATYVVHFDAPWSLAKLIQREDRVHRIGQKKPVTVYDLIVKDSVDEYVHKVLHMKNRTSVALLQDFERLEEKGLSEEDINNILRL